MPMEISHIWVANFTSEELQNSYFEEQYNNDDAPINQFAEDQRELYYDHDWVERSYRETDSVKELIYGHSYSDDYIDKVINLVEKKNIPKVNTLLWQIKTNFHLLSQSLLIVIKFGISEHLNAVYKDA